FVSGRDVSWWLAGTSMVATTFAADTPLFVCGVVARQGIAGNWIWWGFCVGGMLTVFFFARYWRRAEILTDVQFCEIRYGGETCSISSWIQGNLSRAVHELLHPGMGHSGDGQHYCCRPRAGHCGGPCASPRHSRATHAGRSSQHCAGDLRFCDYSVHWYLHVHRRTLGRAGDRSVSV